MPAISNIGSISPDLDVRRLHAEPHVIQKVPCERIVIDDAERVRARAVPDASPEDHIGSGFYPIFTFLVNVWWRWLGQIDRAIAVLVASSCDTGHQAAGNQP